MKKEIQTGTEKNTGQEYNDDRQNLISRKDALRKTGYMALSAATMMLLLNKPSKAQPGGGTPGSSPEKMPGW